MNTVLIIDNTNELAKNLTPLLEDLEIQWVIVPSFKLATLNLYRYEFSHVFVGHSTKTRNLQRFLECSNIRPIFSNKTGRETKLWLKENPSFPVSIINGNIDREILEILLLPIPPIPTREVSRNRERMSKAYPKNDNLFRFKIKIAG